MGDEAPPTPVMSDADFEKALDDMSGGATGDDSNVNQLLQMMNDNKLISWDEAEHMLAEADPSGVVKSGLPPTTRPTEPDNDTDIDSCTARLLANDPTLTEVNLNNMKRTPIPHIQRLISAIGANTVLKKLSLANTALSDAGAEPLIEALQQNSTLQSINLETNFLGGEFLARLFQAALKNQIVQEVKAVNQSPTFSTQSEREMINAIDKNKGLLKVSLNLRLPEGRHKIENAMLRNAEIRRLKRRQEAAAANQS